MGKGGGGPFKFGLTLYVTFELMPFQCKLQSIKIHISVYTNLINSILLGSIKGVQEIMQNVEILYLLSHFLVIRTFKFLCVPHK